MNPLEKELVKIAEKSKDESEGVVNEAKLLLASNVAEERTLLTSIGLDNDIRMVEDKNSEVIIRNTHGSRLGKTVLNFKDIKKLCLNYRLYMRKANNYVGTIPPELGSELNRFCKEKGIPVPAHSDHSNFYIIAPPKMFRDYKSPLKVLQDAVKYADEEAAERERLRNLDPILIYKIDSDHYAIIKSWGSDFTPLRRLYGFFTKRINVKLINVLLNTLVLYGLLKFAIWQFIVLDNKGHGLEVLAVFDCIGLVAVASLWLFLDYIKDLRKSIIDDVTENEMGMRRHGNKYV